MIEVRNCSLSYGETKALDDVSFSLRKGSLTTIVGPSGCGKSSLLNIVAGLVNPQSGVVEIDGEIVRGVRNKTTILFQDLGLFPWKSACENIAFILRDRGYSKIDAHKKACEALELVEMESFKDRYIETLSGGQKQRVGFAKALALDPDVILFDEATAALDAFTSEQIQDVLKNIHLNSDITIVYVTHKIDEAVYLGNSIMVMREGKILKQIENTIYDIENCREHSSFFELCIQVKEAL